MGMSHLPGITGPLLERKDAGSADLKITPELKQLFVDLQKTHNEFVERHDREVKELKEKGTTDVITRDAVDKLNKELDKVQKRLDDATLEAKRPMLTDPSGEKREMTQEEVEHKDAFKAWFTKGRNEEKLAEIERKSLSAGSDPDGGYTVPTQVEQNIIRVVTDISPVRSVAQVMNISANMYKKPINRGGAGAGWVGETAVRPQTNTPTLNELVFQTHELYAMPAATQTLLDDSNINIEQWLADEVRITFAQKEGTAFVNGDGVAKPRGFMNYPKIAEANYTWGNVGFIISGAANDFAADPGAGDAFIDTIQALHPQYRTAARWAMNRATVGIVRKFKDSDGRYQWQPSLQIGQPSSLLGYAITEMEDMADVGDGAFPVAFADFRSAYLIVDRIGIRVLRDPFTSKPYVLFYTTKRVGGGIQNFEAIKLLKSDDG